MDQTDYDGVQLLAPLRETSLAPSAVDVHRAVHEGRRRTRNRRIVGAATLVLILAAIPSIAGALTQGPAVDAGGPAPAEFGVLQQAFTVGSAGGYTPLTYETGRYRQRVQLVLASLPYRQAKATVTMYPRGPLYREGAPFAAWKPTGERAPDVNGHRAYWLGEPVTVHPVPPNSTELAWEWADHAWAFALVEGTGDAARDKAHRVAQSVAPATTDIQATLPFSVAEAAVDPDQLMGAVVPYGPAGQTHGQMQAGLLFGDDTVEDGGNPSMAKTPEYLFVGVQQWTAIDPVTGREPQQTDDRPRWALLDLTDGFTAVAEASSTKVLSQIGGTATLDRLVESVRLVAAPDDPQNWTRQPLH